MPDGHTDALRDQLEILRDTGRATGTVRLSLAQAEAGRHIRRIVEFLRKDVTRGCAPG